MLDDDEVKSGKESYVSILGMLTVVRQDNDSALVMTMPHSSVPYLCVFSTIEKLESAMEQLGILSYKIKQITDMRDFIETAKEYQVRIALDPYSVASENVTRWRELKIYDR